MRSGYRETQLTESGGGFIGFRVVQDLNAAN